MPETGRVVHTILFAVASITISTSATCMLTGPYQRMCSSELHWCCQAHSISNGP